MSVVPVAGRNVGIYKMDKRLLTRERAEHKVAAVAVYTFLSVFCYAGDVFYTAVAEGSLDNPSAVVGRAVVEHVNAIVVLGSCMGE